MTHKAKDTRYKKKNNMYVYGNAVKKAEAVPSKKYSPQIVPHKKHRPTEQERQEERARIRSINRNNRLNLVYTLAISGIVIAMFAICWQYLSIQAKVKENAATVNSLQKELTELTNKNDEMELEINANIDYDSLYNIATQELGMVYPERDQVITYEPGVSEYVKQYSDVPESE